MASVYVRKKLYLWLCRRYLRSEKQRKKVSFSFAFRSLIRTFARKKGRLSDEKATNDGDGAADGGGVP